MPLDPTEIGDLAAQLVHLNLVNYGGGELTVQTYAVDVDHRDLDVHLKQGRGWADLQVKCATHPDAEGRVAATANYPVNDIPGGAGFAYVFCLYDREAPEGSRFWLVPGDDFNRLAYIEHRRDQPGRVQMQFSARLSGDATWGRFEVSREQLAARVLAIAVRFPSYRLEPH